MPAPDEASTGEFAALLATLPGWKEFRAKYTDAQWASAVEEAEGKSVRKDQVRRFKTSVEVMNALLATEKSLVGADSYEDAYAKFVRVVQHVERLWDDACVLLNRGSHPTALALSITCLEEVGKISVARFQLAIDEARRAAGVAHPAGKPVARRGHPFYSHTQKLVLAAGAGALVNARLDRILGMDRVIDFLDRVERNELEQLRQSCLYTDAKKSALLIPAERIASSDATFHVILAGEVLAEVGGFEPEEFERLLAKVEAFERAIGHAAD
jgi:AbiV family abortive infection protein